MAANIRPTVRLQQLGHGGRLFRAMLDQEYAVVGENGTAFGREYADRVEPVLARGQGRQRFMLQMQQGLVVAAHVRWVGNDDIEFPPPDRCRPAAVQELDIPRRQLAHVFTGDRQCAFADVDGRNLAEAALTRDGDRDRATARAKIEHLPFGFTRDLAQREVDQQFRLGARHEGRGTDQQLMGPELPGTRDVGHGFTAKAPLEYGDKALGGQLVEFVFGVCEQVAAGHVDCPAQKDLGVQPRRFTHLRQALRGVRNSGIESHDRVHSPKLTNVTSLPMNVYSNILDMVGQTPMLEVTHLDTGPCRLFLKLELMNPGGSIKDRIGISMIEEAEKRGDIRPGDTIVEATAGNTGLGLALVAAQKDYRLVIVLPDKMSQEKIFNLRAMGAEVILTRSDVGRGHPEYYQDLGKRVAEERGAYFINQFGNPDNPLAHETGTAPEILEQMGGDLDAIVLGVGSSGTVSGIGKFLKEHAPHVDMVLADPEGSILTDYINEGVIGEGGSWLVEGIGEDFIPDIADFDKVVKAFAISDAESFAVARELLRKEGVLAGSSSGTLLAAALRYCREQTAPKRVVTFACDTGNKYLSKLYNDFWMEDQGFIEREHCGDLRDLIGRPHGERATTTVGPTDILTTAHNRLRNAGFSQLPVMHDGRLVGIVTEDAIIQFVYGHPDLMTAPVEQAMESAFIKLDKSESLNNLVAMLRVQPYAAIMDGDDFQGLITRSDVLNYLRRQM